jgi:hypothetical protein
MNVPAYLQKVDDYRTLTVGSVVRRIGSGKDQQGRLIEIRENALVLGDVIDLNAGSFAAEAGLLALQPADELFVHSTNFATSSKAAEARRLIQEWALYRGEPQHQKAILEFVESAYSPEQIIDFAATDQMKNVFVPVQQKLKIGRFVEKINVRKERIERFRKMLESLYDGKHLTYLAFIPRESVAEPMFYSIGTKPHRETLAQLQREEIAFRPNHGGHIKIVSGPNEPRRFIVDAGSNDFGVGVRTHLSTAEMITDALKKLYPEYEFRPVPGRDAYGVEQSY